jgi:hypothetical protein
MSNSFRWLVVLLLGFEAYVALFQRFDWGHGSIRGILLLGILAFLIVLRFRWRPVSAPGEGTRRAVWYALLLAIALTAGFAGKAIYTSAATGKIPGDGDTTWRATRLLWQRQNPYGFGVLVDYSGYQHRVEERKREGVAATVPEADVESVFERYDRTLDRSIGHSLLPVDQSVNPASVEARIMGYKYGPLPVEVTALATPLGQPAIVLLLNVLATTALLAVLYRLMAWQGGSTFAQLGLIALLLDQNIRWNFFQNTVIDVWALLFSALAVMFYRTRRNIACGASLGLGFACKALPSLLFAPLLIAGGSVVPVFAFAAAALAAFAPFLVWDARGVVANVFLWPQVMAPDTTTWLFFAPGWVALPTRLAVLTGVAWMWARYLAGYEKRLYWTLAMVSTLVLFAGNVFHNNYVPWASIFVVLAVVEASSGKAAEQREAASAVAQALRAA